MVIYLLIGVLICPCLIDSSSPPLNSCAGLAGMAVVTCDPSSPSPYRTQNGQCNNLNQLRLGAAVTPFRRLRQASYDDGKSSPRKSKLPNARLLSRKLFPQSVNPDKPWNHSPRSKISTSMASVFGQFLTHDITLTWQRVSTPDSPDIEHFDITIPSDDTVFDNAIPLKRASRCTKTGQPEEQVNAATSFIDASHIYGNNDDELKKVRRSSSLQGLLSTTFLGQSVKDLLPHVPNDVTSVFCRSPFPAKTPCFYTGDYRRNNVSPALNAMHTIWVREHNRIAMLLAGINTHWNNEKIFQETRKIIGAMMQHISYNEYLPTILSEKMLETYDLKLDTYKGYSSSVDPSIPNSFAAAALRFGHSTVGNVYMRPGHTDLQVDDFHNPISLYNLQEGGVDAILKGLFTQSASMIDRYFSISVTRRLIPSPGVTADLAAINIQRGRDHGIPAYVEFRDMFSVSEGNIPNDLKAELLKLYDGKMQDVDLFVGGLVETPETGARVGPTFSHILAEGFKNLRKGDRFWYQNRDDLNTRFTPDQIEEIQHASLAKIICDNSDGIKEIQPSAMLKETPDNQKKSCDQLPSMDLKKWQESSSVVADVPIFPAKRTAHNKKSNIQEEKPEDQKTSPDFTHARDFTLKDR